MKNYKWILVILVAWLPMFIAAWDKAKPAAGTSLRSSNPEILANNTALESVIGQDHEFSTGGTNSGKHLQVTFDDPLGSAPATVAASEGVLYLLDVGGKAELHFEDEDENTLQITSAGDLYSSTGLTVAGNTIFTGTVTANGGITLGAGDDLIGSATSDITFNTNKFTVAGATGNTVVAGTLSVTGVATVGDGSTNATSAAPTADAQLANKKYVDDLIAAEVTARSFGTWTNKDSLNATLVKSEVYKVGSDGFVCVYRTHSGTDTVSYGYTDSANPPTTVRGAFTTQGLDTKNASFMMPIKNDDYFKITATNITPTIYWLPVGSGTCVKQ